MVLNKRGCGGWAADAAVMKGEKADLWFTEGWIVAHQARACLWHGELQYCGEARACWHELEIGVFIVEQGDGGIIMTHCAFMDYLRLLFRGSCCR